MRAGPRQRPGRLSAPIVRLLARGGNRETARFSRISLRFYFVFSFLRTPLARRGGVCYDTGKTGRRAPARGRKSLLEISGGNGYAPPDQNPVRHPSFPHRHRLYRPAGARRAGPGRLHPQRAAHSGPGAQRRLPLELRDLVLRRAVPEGSRPRRGRTVLCADARRPPRLFGQLSQLLRPGGLRGAGPPPGRSLRAAAQPGRGAENGHVRRHQRHLDGPARRAAAPWHRVFVHEHPLPPRHVPALPQPDRLLVGERRRAAAAGVERRAL